MPRKPAAPPNELTSDQIETILGEIAILSGQLNQRQNIIKKHVQHYGPIEAVRGYWADNRQSKRKAPVWSKLALCFLHCKPDGATILKLLTICFKKIGAAGWGGLLGLLLAEDGLPQLTRRALLLLDDCDEDGGNKIYYGNPSIGIRKSAADGSKSITIPLGEEAVKDDPDEVGAVFVDGVNLSLVGEDEDEDAA